MGYGNQQLIFDLRGSLSMRIRPDGAFGPLFYAHDESQDHFLSVYLANGFVAVSSNTSTEAKVR